MSEQVFGGYDEGYDEEEDLEMEHKLKFPKDRFYGRREELKKLLAIYQDMCDSKKRMKKFAAAAASAPPLTKKRSKRKNFNKGAGAGIGIGSGHLYHHYHRKAPLILLNGYSGAGKSSLVKKMVQTINQSAARHAANPFATSMATAVTTAMEDDSVTETEHEHDSIIEVVDHTINEHYDSNDNNNDNNKHGKHSPTKPKKYKPCYFLSGKYEESFQGTSNKPTTVVDHQPFRAILEAFGQFADSVLNHTDLKEQIRIKQAVQTAIGNEAKGLTDVVPTLAPLFESTAESSMQESQNDFGVSGSGGGGGGIPEESETHPAASPATNKNYNNGDSDNNNNDTNNNNDADTAAIHPPLETNSQFKWHRFIYLFQRFIMAICSSTRPVILFLDDLQWADSASLDLLTSLLTTKTPYLLVIGTVRSNDFDMATHPLSKKLERIELKRPIVRMDLLNLSMEDIGQFIADTLELSVEETQPLTQAVYHKTRGNMFFTIQALEELHRRNVIFFSVISFSWEWNLKGVDLLDESLLPDNVVEVVATKIQSAPEKLQLALTVAAYTRSTFDVQTLHSLLEMEGCSIKLPELVKILDTAVLEGLLHNSVGSKHYRFAHDRIQQAAYSLVPSGTKRDELRARIGSKLFQLVMHTRRQQHNKNGPSKKQLLPPGPEQPSSHFNFEDDKKNTPDNDWMLFVAADHLNDNNEYSPLSAIELAELNLSCGEKAMAIAAFAPAVNYLRTGLSILRNATKGSYWKTNYDLSVRIFSAATDSELTLGNFEDGRLIGQELLENAQNLEDTLPTYRVLAEAQGRQDRTADALQLYITALELLGHYPKRFFAYRVLKDYRVMRKFLNKSDYDILLLPPMTDPLAFSAMRFLTECSLRAYMCGKYHITLFCIIRRLKLSYKYGLCGYTAQALAAYSTVVSTKFKNFALGLRLGRLAKKILDRSQGIYVDSLVLNTVYSYFDAWSETPKNMLAALHRAHLAGMEVGDMELGHFSWLSKIYHAYQYGYPLKAIASAKNELIDQLEKFSVDSVLGPTVGVSFAIDHLMGTSNEPINWTEIEKYGEGVVFTARDFPNLLAIKSRIQLAVYFHEYEIGEIMLERAAPLFPIEITFLGLVPEVFYKGIIYFARAKQTGNRKYTTLAKKMTAKMKNFTSERGLNALHYSLILDALCTSLSCKDVDKQRGAFDTAIKAAMELGCIQDAAFACELAGEYFVDANDTLWPGHYFTKARDLFHQWGAKTKVDHLQMTQSKYIETVVSTMESGGSRSNESSMMIDPLFDDMFSSDFNNDHRYHDNMDVSVLGGLSVHETLPASLATAEEGSSMGRERDEVSNFSNLSNPSELGGGTKTTVSLAGSNSHQ